MERISENQTKTQSHTPSASDWHQQNEHRAWNTLFSKGKRRHHAVPNQNEDILKHIPTWICVLERRTPFNPIQPSWTARPPDSEEGSEVGVGQQRRRRPPSLHSLQTWPPPPPPNSFPSLATPIFISSFPQIARSLALYPTTTATESAGRQIHPLPPWSKEAGRHRLPSKGLGCQPTLAASPQFLFHLQLLRPSTARARRTSTGQGRAGQGRAGQGDNRHQLLLQIIGRI